jgi:hypothetical protein
VTLSLGVRSRSIALSAALAALAGVVGCSVGFARGEGIDTSALPETVKGDYAVFAQRCSKCHSLARPLSSGIDDDDYWAMYVARMRRQPGSGISQEDTVVVLRFLHYFSEEQRRKKDKRDLPSPPPQAPPSAPTPLSSSLTAAAQSSRAGGG